MNRRLFGGLVLVILIGSVIVLLSREAGNRAAVRNGNRRVPRFVRPVQRIELVGGEVRGEHDMGVFDAADRLRNLPNAVVIEEPLPPRRPPNVFARERTVTSLEPVQGFHASGTRSRTTPTRKVFVEPRRVAGQLVAG